MTSQNAQDNRKRPEARKKQPRERKSNRDGSDNKNKAFIARKQVIIPLLIIALLAAVGALYYTPMKIWYREARQERVLRAQLVEIQKYNQELEQEISSLNTTEGIEDFASSQLELVYEGENAVIITKGGKPLSESTDTRAGRISRLGEEASPFGMWTPFLDALFGGR